MKKNILLIFLNLFFQIQAFGFDIGQIDNNLTKESVCKTSKEFLEQVKKNPYKVSIEFNTFANNYSFLKRRVSTNKKYGAKTAAIRDKIELEYIDDRKKIKDLFLAIISGYKNLDNPDSILKKIELIKIEKKSEIYKEMLGLENNSSIKSTALNNLTKLEKAEKEFSLVKKCLVSLLTKENSVLKHSILEQYSLNDTIDMINEKSYHINRTLKPYGIDAGRVIVFFVVLIVFLILSFLVNKLLLPVINFIIEKIFLGEADHDEIVSAFNGFKRPLFLLIFIFGLEAAFEIAMHPQPLNPVFINFIVFAKYTLYAVLVSRIIDLSFVFVTNKGWMAFKRSEIANLISRVVKIIIFTIALTLYLSYLGVDTSKIITSLGIGSMAIAFASKDLIASFFSGLKLIIDDSFSPGDWIRVSSGEEGTIVDVGFINTRIRTFDNGLLSIPNKKITEHSYINWSRRKVGRQIKMDIGITYDSKKEDIRRGIQEIEEMLLKHPDISPASAKFNKKRVSGGRLVAVGDEYGLKNTTFVKLKAFGDFAIIFEIYTFSKTVNWMEWLNVKEDIMFRIMDILENNNLEFAFPTNTVYLKKDQKDSFDTQKL